MADVVSKQRRSISLALAVAVFFLTAVHGLVVPSSLTKHRATAIISPLTASPPIPSLYCCHSSQTKSNLYSTSSSGTVDDDNNPDSVSSGSSSSSSSSSSSWSNPQSVVSGLSANQQSLLSAAILVVLDIVFRRGFQKLQLSFPSSLGGCCLLFMTLCTTGTFGRRLYRLLSPGAAVLAKWLPVFFVPSLVTLPLVGGDVATPVEIAKVMTVIVVGFFFTLLTTSGSVLFVDKVVADAAATTASSSSNDSQQQVVVQDIETPNLQPPVPPPKPFSDELMKQLRIVAIFSGIAALEGASPAFTSHAAKFLTKYQTPFLTMLLGSTTLASFCYGARMPKSFTKVVHPLVTCTALTWAVMGLFAKCVEGRTFSQMLQFYKMGNGWNGLFGTGAGDVLLFLLGPAVVSLAISMFDKRQLIRDNLTPVATGVAVSSIGGLFGTAWMVRLAQIAQPSLRVALLSRNITSPLAMAIAGILGANAATVSLAVSMVVVTGLIGANFGASILSAFGITNPVARGMGIGAAAHGLGTAAFVDEKDAFPVAAISMALTATACTVLVSIPFIKNLVLKIALG